MLKSVLGGIGAWGRPDRQRAAVRQIHRALKPGGLFLFAENVAGTPLHRLPRWIKWRGGWRYLKPDEMQAMLAAFADVSIGTTGFLALFGPSEGQRRLLGRLDATLCHHLPASWHYVMYGVARK
jgi:SAM-dependent methyltransferase